MNLFKEHVPDDKIHLWVTGPKVFDDYTKKSSYMAGFKANQYNYLSMIEYGVYSYGGRGGSISTAHTKEDKEKISVATENTLKQLRENKLIGITK